MINLLEEDIYSVRATPRKTIENENKKFIVNSSITRIKLKTG